MKTIASIIGQTAGVERLVLPARTVVDPPALLVLLHGLGSNEADLYGLAPELDRRFTVVCLRAPFEYGYGGFAWFDVQWTEQGLAFSESEALESLEGLTADLQSLRSEFGVLPARTVLGGFSQGAMMTMGALLREPASIGGAMLLSGAAAPSFAKIEGQIGHRVFQSHGTDDPVLPVALGRQTRDLLAARGAQVEYHEYAMAHEINGVCLRDAKFWLERFLNDS